MYGYVLAYETCHAGEQMETCKVWYGMVCMCTERLLADALPSPAPRFERQNPPLAPGSSSAGLKASHGERPYFTFRLCSAVQFGNKTQYGAATTTTTSHYCRLIRSLTPSSSNSTSSVMTSSQDQQSRYAIHAACRDGQSTSCWCRCTVLFES